MSIFTIKFDDIPVRGFKAHEFKSEVRSSSGTFYAVVVKSTGQWFWRTLLVGGISDFDYRTALAHSCDVFERATGRKHPSYVNPDKNPPAVEDLKPGQLPRDFGLPGGRRRTDPPMEATRRKVVPGRRGRIDELENDDDIALLAQLSRSRNVEFSYVDPIPGPSPSCSPRSSHSSHSDSDYSTSRSSCSSSHSSSHSSHSSSSSDSSSSSSDSSSSSSSD